MDRFLWQTIRGLTYGTGRPRHSTGDRYTEPKTGSEGRSGRAASAVPSAGAPDTRLGAHSACARDPRSPYTLPRTPSCPATVCATDVWHRPRAGTVVATGAKQQRRAAQRPRELSAEPRYDSRECCEAHAEQRRGSKFYPPQPVSNSGRHDR